MTEVDILISRRAIGQGAALWAGGPATAVGSLTVGWHHTAAHPETGAVALVAYDGLLDLIGDLLRVTHRGRSVDVYCVGSAAVPTELSLTRRAFQELAVAAREEITCDAWTLR